MDPVRDKTSISQDSPSPMSSSSTAGKKPYQRPTPPKSPPPPLPDLDEDVVKPGTVGDSDEPTPPASMKPLAPEPKPNIQSHITSPPPPPPPPPEKSGEEPMKPATPPTGSSMNAKGKVLLAAGPLFLVASLGISAFIVNTRPASPTQFPVEQQTQPANPTLEEAANFDEERLKYILENSPVNPTEATATCQSTGETIESGESTSCPDPVFTWSGEYSKEPGTEIIGYYVYFGTKSDDSPISLQSKLHDVRKVIQPFRDGIHQSENFFTPQELNKNTTYYLAVSAESSTQNGDIRLGLDPVSLDPPAASSAKILFTYIYE